MKTQTKKGKNWVDKIKLYNEEKVVKIRKGQIFLEKY